MNETYLLQLLSCAESSGVVVFVVDGSVARLISLVTRRGSMGFLARLGFGDG